jgi:hypothetical protein
LIEQVDPAGGCPPSGSCPSWADACGTNPRSNCVAANADARAPAAVGTKNFRRFMTRSGRSQVLVGDPLEVVRLPRLLEEGFLRAAETEDNE